MRLIIYLFVAFGWFSSFCSISYGETRIDNGLQYFGVYQISLRSSYEDKKGTIFRETIQRLEITKSSAKEISHEKVQGSLANISIHLSATNGHTCEYAGTGRWDKFSDRFEFTNNPDEYDDELICKLVVIIKNSSAYTVTQSKGCQMFCGMRNSLDGWIFRKVK